MPIRSVTLRILGESKDALAKMKAVNAEADKLEARKVNVRVGVDLDNKDVAALKAKVTALGKLTATINVKIDMPNILADFAKIKLELQALRVLASKLDITPHTDIAELARANAMLVAMNIAAQKAAGGVRDVGTTARTTNTILQGLFQPGQGFGLWGKFFMGKFPLFAGLAGTIGTIHLLADAIVEVAAVWIPATLAAGAFGIAASDAVMDIVHHMTDLHTVADATGQAIPPMTDAMEKLHDAVRPAVYQVFGDALTVINQKSSLFSKLAMGASQVVDQLAARMAVAVTHGHGLNDFMANAVSDLSKLGNSFGDLFGIIGNLLKAVPGYAQILLDFGEGFLRLLEYVTRVGEPFIHLGLVVHGFLVWAGLGATAAFALGKGIIFLGSTALGTAVKTFAIFVADLITIAATEGIATAATFAFSAALDVIAANPLIWIGAAVGALAALVFWMSRSKSATQAWGDSLQKTIDNSSTVIQGIDNLRQAQIQTGDNLNRQTEILSRTQKMGIDVNLHTGIASKVVTQAYKNQSDAVGQAREQYNRFNQEAAQSTGRLNGLAKAYGGQKNAMALVNAAGITESEWQDHSAEGWAILIQRINGTIAGYKAMGQAGGTLNNDLSVMDKYTTDQYNAMQKLNQAWSTFTGELTGGQSAFDTVAQGLNVLGNNSATASRHLGTARLSSVGLGHAMDGLKASDIALNQAFTTQIGNVSSLFATWRTAGIANTEFTRGVKDSIAPMVRYAKGSQEATAQLVGLAEQAGYSGPISLSRLVKWLGNTQGATEKVKMVTNDATKQEALLTGAMQAQGSYIANTLIRDIQNAEMAYFGVTGKARDYGNAVAKYGDQSVQAKQKADALTTSIIESGRRAHETTGDMAALISKILHIPLSRAISIVERGTGKFSITGPGGQSVAGPGGRFNSGQPVATGTFVTGGTPGVDSVLLRAMPGELVVPTKLVNSGAVDHLRGMIPGFAEGGVVHSGDRLALSGQAAVNFNTDFIGKFTSSMESAMSKAMQKAINTSAQTFGGGLGRASLRQIEDWWIGAGGPGGGTAHVAAAITGAESGFNPRAVQAGQPYATTGWGLWQITPGDSEPQAGINAQLLNGPANAIAAVAKYRGAGGFSPWTTFEDGAYLQFMHNGGTARPGWAMLGEMGPELVKMKGGESVLSTASLGSAPMPSPRRGGDVYNIMVNGDTDPDGAALKIIQKIRKYKSRHGSATLGIG